MHRLLPFALIASLAAPVAAQGGAAGMQQVPVQTQPLRVAPVAANQSSPTQARSAIDRVPPRVLAACREAQAKDQPAPAGVDCVKAMQVAQPAAAKPAAPTAETSLLGLLGQNGNVTGDAVATADAANADSVARQLATPDGAVVSDAAASVARARAAPPTTPPPR